MDESQSMNRHERLYRRTGKALLAGFGLWILAMGSVMFAPSGIQDTDPRYIAGACIVMLLFAAMFVLGVIQIVAYIRWKRPEKYSFFFRDSTEASDSERRN
jgi:hypothetical protein